MWFSWLHVCVCVCVFRVEFWLGLSSVRLAASQNTRHFIKVQTAFEWSDAHGTVYLDLDLSIAFRSLSMSSFLLSRDLLSCRFSSPSSSDLISELTDEVLWPCRPPERAGEHKHSVSEEHHHRHVSNRAQHQLKHRVSIRFIIQITWTLRTQLNFWIKNAAWIWQQFDGVIMSLQRIWEQQNIYIYMCVCLRSREWRWEDE